MLSFNDTHGIVGHNQIVFKYYIKVEIIWE